jgi:hypothetical protein
VTQSTLERSFVYYLRILAPELPLPVEEYSFTRPLYPKVWQLPAGWKRWRFDFCWVEVRLAVECEGGIGSRGRHVRVGGYVGDCDKYNAAALAGFRVLRFTNIHLNKDPHAVIATVKAALGANHG